MALKGYDPTSWSPGMAITANRMMNIEQALDGAVDAIISLETTTQGLRTDVDTKASSTALSDLSDIVSRKADSTTVTTLSGLIGDTLLTGNTQESFISSTTITGQLTEAIQAIHNIRSSSGNGDAAYSALTNIGAFGGNSLFDQIYEAVGYTGTGANRTLLYPRNGADDEGNSTSFTVKQDLDNVREKISNLNSIITTATTQEYSSLADRINAVAVIANAARSEVAGATGDPSVSLPSKISSIDSNLLAINTQLTAAKASTAWGNKENLGTAKTFLDGTDASGNPVYGIDSRLEAMESYILDDSTGLESRIMNIFGNNINESNTVAQAIAAINSKLGNGISSQNTVTSAIATALETAKTYADDEKVDKDDIVNDYNYVPSGDAAISTRLHKVLSASRGKDLNDRLTAKETEITNAHSSAIKGTNNTPRTFNSLDERFEDIETDVNTIANELSMYNQAGAISDANTRIDTIEKNVLEMGKEIGMISDLSTVQNLSDTVVRNDTDIDKLKAQIAGARIQTGTDAQGNPTYQYADLDGRFDTIEDSLNNSTTGVVPRVTALETDMDAAKGKIEVLEGTTATGAVKYGDIINNIDTPNDASHTNKVLDARQGATIKAIKTEVEGAHRTLASGVADTLDNRFDDIESRTTTIENTVNNPTTGVSMLNTRVGTLESSLSGYTGANAVSSKFSSVDTEIGTIKSTINMNEFGTTAGNTVADKLNTKVAKADIANDLTITTEGKVLDARQGKVLNDSISTMDAAYKAADEALSSRITDAQNEIDAAHRTDDDTLDDRFDAIEGVASRLRTDVNEIATELSMLDNDTLAGTQSRIDNIETAIDHVQGENDEVPNGLTQRITTLETTIDAHDGLSDRMSDAEERLNALDDESNGAIAGLDNRIDTINYTINHTATQEDNTTGLTQHISALETTVNDDTTGVVATATALGNLTTRVNSIDNNQNGALKTLDDRLDAIDGGTQLSITNGTLDARVTALETAPKSATVVISVSEFNSLEANEANSTKDYLVGPDSNRLYKYYHIIETSEGVYTKVLISGGSEGNASAYYYTAADYEQLSMEDKKENTDYYVFQSDLQYSGSNTTYYISAYHHYRIITENGQKKQIEIGTPLSRAKTYNMEKVDVQVPSEDNPSETETVSYLRLYEYDYGADNSSIDTQSNAMHLRAEIELPKGGGGSGQISTSTNRLVRIGDDIVQTITGEKINLYVFFSAYDEYETYTGQGTLKLNGITINSDLTFSSGSRDTTPANWVVVEEPEFSNQVPNISSPDPNKIYIIRQGNNFSTWTYQSNTWSSVEGTPSGFYSIDVSQYCTTGTNTFSLSVLVNQQKLGKTWTIEMIDLHLESTAPDTLLINYTENYAINYIAYGLVQKDLYVTIDNREPAITQLSGNSSGIPSTYPLGLLTHGVHTIKMQLKARIGGKLQESNEIVRQYIWYNPDAEVGDTIIACRYAGLTENKDQYSIIEIPYQVYKKGATTIQVEYYLDNAEEPFETATLEDTDTGLLTYVAQNTGMHTITIKVENTQVSMHFNITAMPNKDISPVGGAIIDFDPAMYNNASSHREPTWTVGQKQYKLTVSDNFNWSNDISGGGYKKDEDGNCFVVKAGTYAYIDYKMFERDASNNNASVFDTGAEMKIIFKTKAVRDIEAIWFQNIGTLMDKSVGIQLGAHYGWLKTDKATNEDVTDTTEEYNPWESGKTDYNLNDVVIWRKKSTDAYTIYKYIKQAINYTLLEPNNSGASKLWFSLNANNWTSGTAYKKNAVVKLNNVTYTCIKDLIEDYYTTEPSNANVEDYWEVSITPWTNGTEYSKGIITTVGNDYYLCIKNVDTEHSTLSPTADTNKTYWQKITTWQIGTNSSKTTYTAGQAVIYNDIIYKCISDVTNEFTITPKDASKIWLKMGETQNKISATNSYLYFPYSEEDKIELDININRREGSGDSFIMSYEDGVPSKAYAYGSSDNLYHSNTIKIGSPDCDVYIYHLRIYRNALSTQNILQNFIADGKNIIEKINRYDRNCIYWDSDKKQYFTAAIGNAKLDPIQLAKCLPDVKILMLDTPRFTTGKKDFVKDSTLRCIHATGGTVYPSRGDADNWYFYNGFHAGQGTTSDNYGQSARNVDFLFEADGVHWPTKSKNMQGYSPKDEPNYKSSVLIGENATKWIVTQADPAGHWEPTSVYNTETEQWELNSDILTEEEIASFAPKSPSVCDDWKGDNCKISLTSTSVPNNYFNLKENVASSENVNNALFQKRYNEFLADVYKSPAYRYSSNIKSTMEFVPAILFLRENDADTSKHNEFKDTAWHFYGLGNLGDSKKTDYTRAYNPKDISEFTVENSDNNTNNGQFQSGVWYYLTEDEENNTTVKAIETSYDLWVNTKSYSKGDIVVRRGKLYIRTGNDQNALGDGETYEWTTADWSEIPLIGWNDSTAPYFSPRKNPNPKEYIYPISTSAWNVKINIDDQDYYVNTKHEALVTEEFDGDHSFEFRYACLGDYRDGDLINDTTGLANEQEKINHDLVLDFYEWLITSNAEDYENEASEWFVPEAMEFFYAFTHYYTMMDNRAKNTFWHWGRRYISTADADGTNYNAAVAQVAATQELIDAASTDAEKAELRALLKKQILRRDELEYLYNNASCFDKDDGQASIRDGHRFDLWVYDTDTALGIDNNGELVFPYGKEDTDFRVEGDPDSGYAFNGAGSIFWRRLSETFASDIAVVMNKVSADCFSAENLINEFDEFQNCFPEEIWRLDIERKYIRTFTGITQALPYDNAVATGKQNPRFLTAMMQGRKKYQRRQWIRNQSVYFNSKYRLKDILSNSNTIEFNCTTPTDINNVAVAPNYVLELIPYQDMYLNITIGNGTYLPPERAKAGRKYEFNLADYSSGSYQETRIYINGANYLSQISNLAPMYPYSPSFSALAHMKVLDLGTDVVEYSNTKFDKLNLSSNTPLLETLNIKNCHSINGAINLSNANNLRVLEATGTAITGVTLPDYTVIKTLHLPTSVQDLTLYSARQLIDFYIGAFEYDSELQQYVLKEDYSNFYKMKIHESDYSQAINWIDIACEMLEKESPQTEIRLTKLYNTELNDITKLETLNNLKKIIEKAGQHGTIELNGTINITGDWSEAQVKTYAAITQPQTYNSAEGIYEDSGTVIESTTSTWPSLKLNARGTKRSIAKINYMQRSYYDVNGELVPEKQLAPSIYVSSDSNSNDSDRIIPDVFAHKPLNKLPTRESTIEFDYQFGTIQDEAYVTYSGWELYDGTLLSDNHNDNVPYYTTLNAKEITLYAHFNSTEHLYTIQWYLTPDEMVKEVYRQQYGKGEGIAAPTIKEMRDVGYKTYDITTDEDTGNIDCKVFMGWNRLPANIRPTVAEAKTSIYRIDAVWSNEPAKPLYGEGGWFEDTSELSPLQLLLWSRLTPQERAQCPNKQKIIANLRYNYEMGYNGQKEGKVLIETRAVKRYESSGNGEAARYGVEEITPFANNNGFTLVLDYKFNPEQVSNEKQSAVLVGCYDKTNGSTTGFALYRDFYRNTSPQQEASIRVGCGDMFRLNGASISKSESIGYIDETKKISYRNIVVIRHPANTSSLWIYSSRVSDVTNIGESIAEPKVITLDNWSLNANAKLWFGNLREYTSNDSYDSEKNNIRGAMGTIYWAKYWDEDLGHGECSQLAAWPHEQMTAQIVSVDNSATNDTLTRPSLYFTNLTDSSHGIVELNKFMESTSWKDSKLNTICNNHIFSGMPIELQSILSHPAVGYRPYKQTLNSFGDYRRELGSLESVQNYIYLPSISSLLSSNVSGYEGESKIERSGDSSGNSDITPYNWLNGTDSIRVYAWTASGWTLSDDSNNNKIYYNLRFPNKAISWSSSNPMRIFLFTDSMTYSTLANQIAQNGTYELKEGDIAIINNSNSANEAYMYVNSATYNNYGTWRESISNTKFTVSSGGWIKALGHLTRSAYVANENNSNNNFIYIAPDSTAIFPSSSANSTIPPVSLTFAFTI